MKHKHSFLRAWAALGSFLVLGLGGGSAYAQSSNDISTDARPANINTPYNTSGIDPMATARYVGEKICGECHDTEKALFGHTQHAKIFRENPRNDVEKAVCEACHGPGSLHVVDTRNRDKIIGFSKEWGSPIEKMNGQCLACHDGGERQFWKGSIHQKNKLACSDCHNPMSRFSTNDLLKKASISETCYTCHQQQRMEFKKKSHMPLPEGKMSCADCHNPHGTPNKRLLKANSVNKLCYACHAEKRGPFLIEHAPVRQNCLNCHLPHGSNNDKLLFVTRPMLCMQCHDRAGNDMGHNFRGTNGNNTGTFNAQMQGRSCQVCHPAIHGSNSPSGSRFRN